MPQTVCEAADLRTPRLRLVAMTGPMLQADLERDGALGCKLGAVLPPEWPPQDWEPHVVAMTIEQLRTLPCTYGWHRYVLHHGSSKATLVGCIGAFLKPEGVAELGYSILPPFQHRGYGTEAVTGLIAWLTLDPHVRTIVAQAPAEKSESIKVMQRCGLQYVGAGDDAGTVRYALSCCK